MRIPPPIDSVQDQRLRDSHGPRPLSDGHARAVGFDEEVVALVVRLGAAVSPNAIARRIAPVVVEALNRMISRGLPHVGKKGVEGFPAIAQGDPAPAVVMVRGTLGVCASLLHASPRVVGRAVFQSVSLRLCETYISSKATAALLFPFSKRVGRDIDAVAAVADTSPDRLSVVTDIPRDSREAVELLPGYVDQFRHVAMLALPNHSCLSTMNQFTPCYQQIV